MAAPNPQFVFTIPHLIFDGAYNKIHTLAETARLPNQDPDQSLGVLWTRMNRPELGER